MKKINITFEDDRAEFAQVLDKSVVEFEKVSAKLKELTYGMEEETLGVLIARMTEEYKADKMKMYEDDDADDLELKEKYERDDDDNR